MRSRNQATPSLSLSRVLIFAVVVCGIALVPIVASSGEHRSRAVARDFQREHPCPSTGGTTGACPGYRKDHIVPLACRGPDAVSNMQWQTVAEARAWDGRGWALNGRLGTAGVILLSGRSKGVRVGVTHSQIYLSKITAPPRMSPLYPGTD